jgi:uncharacterized protein (DUF488 family)
VYHGSGGPNREVKGIPKVGRLVYTLGTSTRSLDEFVALLKRFGVEVVIDVRRFPSSRFPHFRREQLAGSLRQQGIDYYHLGEKLGGYRKGGCEAFSATEEFKQGVRELTEIACQRATAIVCAERLPWRCHRRFIGAELSRQGWQVVHIIDEKRNWSPQC